MGIYVGNKRYGICLSRKEKEGWKRPSEWPDYSKIPLSGVGANEVYLTYDCRPAIRGEYPSSVCFKATASGGYTVERGNIGNSGFVAVATTSVASNTNFQEELPTDEGNYVVYRITSTGNITNFALVYWPNYVGNKNYDYLLQSCVEAYGKLELATGVTIRTYALVSFSVVMKSLTSMSNQFYTCYTLANVDTTGWDTSSVNSFQSCFYMCYSLRYLDTRNIDVSSATNTAGMFNGCPGLLELDVSGWDVSNVTNMSSMFSGCRSLKELDVSDWDTSSVTGKGMTSVFSDCPNLETLDVSDWDISGVEEITSIFNECRKLNTIDLHDWDFGSVTATTSMLRNCQSLKGVRIGSTLTVVSANTFNGINMAETVVFLSTTPPTMANTNAFTGINSATKIYVPDASVNAYKTAENWSTYASYIYPLSEYVEP